MGGYEVEDDQSVAALNTKTNTPFRQAPKACWCPFESPFSPDPCPSALSILCLLLSILILKEQSKLKAGRKLSQRARVLPPFVLLNSSLLNIDPDIVSIYPTNITEYWMFHQFQLIRWILYFIDIYRYLWEIEGWLFSFSMNSSCYELIPLGILLKFWKVFSTRIFYPKYQNGIICPCTISKVKQT